VTVPVRWNLSRHARRLLTLAVAGLGLALVTGRPGFAGAAAPALLLLSAWRPGHPPDAQVTAGLTATRIIEGEQAAVTVSVTGAAEYTAAMLLHPAHEIVPLRSAAGQRAGYAAGHQVTLPFLVSRWGRRRVGTAEIVLRDRWRLAEGRAQVGLPSLECYPRPATQRTRVVLSRLPQRLGEHSARAPGEGSEFAGVREYVPGDRQRSINWPATTRRGRLQVNTFAGRGDLGRHGLGRRRRRAPRGGHRAPRRGRRRPGLPGRAGPGGVHHLPLPGPLAGAGARAAALLPDRRGHAHPGP
jgi:uncharacterized protein (DUF58 family)